MAEKAAQDRTEEATPKRIQEAREKGDVAKSVELSSAVLMLSVVLLFYFTGHDFLMGLSGVIQEVYSSLSTTTLTTDSLPMLGSWMTDRVITIMGPILVLVLVMGLLVNYLQVGVIFAPKALGPNWERINPLTGLKRIFSTRGLVELIKGILKMIIVGTIIYIYLSERIKDYPFLTYMTTFQIIGSLASDLFRIGLYVGLAYLVMGAADYFYQRWEYKRKLRMTQQEVKDEHRQTEGSPEVRSRLRVLQRELSRNRMMTEVARASVVITNPTHVAVALSYQEAGDASAPKLVAKGQRKVAERIKEVARAHDVPIKENPVLARALFDNCEIGAEIPYTYYQAVAELLAEIFWDRYGTGKAPAVAVPV
ncbi:MAG: flagellar biosynthesis protein FlhB [Candidatus Marinimicrobia bacterium]|nr:flagellar biosynthesis protein FlhB [Candidatus Neomarinimicrobiota bacterium]